MTDEEKKNVSTNLIHFIFQFCKKEDLIQIYQNLQQAYSQAYSEYKNTYSEDGLDINKLYEQYKDSNLTDSEIRSLKEAQAHAYNELVLMKYTLLPCFEKYISTTNEFNNGYTYSDYYLKFISKTLSSHTIKWVKRCYLALFHYTDGELRNYILKSSAQVASEYKNLSAYQSKVKRSAQYYLAEIIGKFPGNSSVNTFQPSDEAPTV